MASDPPAALPTGSDDALQLIVDQVTDIAGWGVAALGVVRGDKVEMAAVAGDDEARAELLGTSVSLDYIVSEMAAGDDWGRFSFVPHGRTDSDIEDWGWVPEHQGVEAEDAWHPHDLLCAALRDGRGEIRGTLPVDIPPGGRRPGPENRALLDKYAGQAERALLAALGREELAEQVRLAETARQVVRDALGQRSLGSLFATVEPALVEGFRAFGVWIQTFDDFVTGTGPGTRPAPAGGVESVHQAEPDPAGAGTTFALPRVLVDVARDAARQAWADREVLVLGRRTPPSWVPEQAASAVLADLDSVGVGSLLLVPIGVVEECLGMLVLARHGQEQEWTEIETSAALMVGRDLGSAIYSVRAYEREHQLVEELRALDSYKSELIATVSHELKSPLTAILGHLEILQGDTSLPAHVRSSHAVMDRGAQRLGTLVEDLLLLSKVNDPSTPLDLRPVDVRTLAHEVADLLRVNADQRGVRLAVQAPERAVLVPGDPDELERALTNLVSNAIKYTPSGGAVTVSITPRGEDEVEVACTDEGIGISPADQGRLFAEFFRSTNPQALAEPGTGLGLTIVARIVGRHGGRIALESTLGRGSTFRITLPAAR